MAQREREWRREWRRERERETERERCLWELYMNIYI
jgi:hypothetical protein